MSQTPCHFFNSPRGCRSGNSCRFSHAANGGGWRANERPLSPTSSAGTSPGRGGGTMRGTGRPSFSTPQAPRGKCNFYWATGHCRREFDCRFEHTRNPDAAGSATQSRTPQRQGFTPANTVTIDAIAPFLTDAGLNKINGSGTDVFFSSDSSASLSPTEAHSHLKRFLHDSFRFSSAFEVYAFLKPLSSANASNGLWTQEEGQLLLSTITSNNGLLRIIDIINWPLVSIQAGSNRSILSFQRGLLPLLRYMSSEFVVKSTLTTQANMLFMTVIENLPHFADVIEANVSEAMAVGSFRDSTTLNKDQAIGNQVLASLSGILYEILVRFKNAVSTYPRIAPLVMNLRDWFDQWLVKLSATPAAFDDPFKAVQPEVRDLITGAIKDKVMRLVSIVEREQGKTVAQSRREPRSSSGAADENEGLLSALHSSYEGPGELRSGGSRHDNDFQDIYDIRIAPTHEELLCRLPPFLPANIYGAPHPSPPESMQKLLDIQFRLLREELTAPLRMAVQLVGDDLKVGNRKKTRLADILEKGGGKYRGYADGQENIMFNVYANAEFTALVPDRRGLSVSITVQSPPGRASSPQSSVRASFWEGMSGKRLAQGGLIALVWQSGSDVSVHLGIIASSLKDLTDSAKQDARRVKVRIVFFDSKIELRILQALKGPNRRGDGIRLLVESPVMFEAIRPFLEALKVEPETLPFSRYMVHRPPRYFDTCKIEPPKYTQVPGFAFQLSSLFPESAGIADLRLSISDATSVENSRSELRRGSRLDGSQADAIIDALSREVALIQGPPGTGKSFTGVELLRVLIANHVRPILMIAFTNHALDHMLGSVLDAGITKKVVRLGSRSADQRIADFSIETLEMVTGHSRLDRSFAGRHRALKDVQEQITKLMHRILSENIESESIEIVKYLSSFYPEHCEWLSNPPAWIVNLRALNDGEELRWQRQGRGRRIEDEDHSLYAYWKNGDDVDFLEGMMNAEQARRFPGALPAASSNMFGVLASDDIAQVGTDTDSDVESDVPTLEDGDEDTESDEDVVEERWMKIPVRSLVYHHDDLIVEGVTSPDSSEKPQEPVAAKQTPFGASDVQDSRGFFAALGHDGVPPLPSSDRPLQKLFDVGDVWAMSRSERRRLHEFWVGQVRIEMQQNQMGEFERLRELHATTLRQCNEGKEETRRQLLENVDIIGCTTTGAAKLASLLKGLSPRVLLVEEAGQVMEAHVLGSLVPSVEHLILIGDPLQLRPTLNNYSLSMDSRRGRELYKFDMSLMERLSRSGLSMSRIDVQRRMRPTISSLIRNTLYPGLIDHEMVNQYPSVQGLAKDVFFLTHDHKENGGADDTASKYNIYEVEMIKDLVLYLLRQGCYSEEGDIVVLCAYLGQLARLRDALSHEVAVLIDERDQQALSDQEDDKVVEQVEGTVIERVRVTSRVRLRTVDNYQGEEGRIVILSLVRNSGALDDETDVLGINHGAKPNIGFLRSENRTNVALSRAREGLFIFGNAANLSSRSNMWRSIIEELEAGDALGNALPIVCHRHPDSIEYVSEPNRLPRVAPDGGCMRPCESRLKCGHLCPFKCHCDDPKHVSVVCSQECRRLCSRGHPCNKQCATACGDCVFPIYDVELPCGHTVASIPCHQLDSLDDVYCNEVMLKQLPHCEHTASMPCSQNTASYSCASLCGCLMQCCGKSCAARCYQCQAVNSRPPDNIPIIPRVEHRRHPCQKSLYCEHLCREPCAEGHEHTTICMEPCRQVCPHARCQLPCSTPCAPCQEPCTWNCPHFTCPVPCGSVCARLPCDKRCEFQLICGHRCPSVCGEECDVQVCPICASDNKKAQIVDLILQRSLEDITPDLETLDELLITVPSCRHVFTVETLDGHCGLADYYLQKGVDGPWVGLRAPPHGFKQPPTCPTCRAAITSPRYGRIFKRADLDILERNVAAKMSRSLGEVQTANAALSQEEMKAVLLREAASIKFTKKNAKSPKSLNQRRAAVLKTNQKTPVSERDLHPANTHLHDIDSSVVQAWRKATHGLFKAYRDVFQVAETRSAHLHAWEAAFSCLFNREIEAAKAYPDRAPRRPTEHAMRVAKMAVGQPRPLADQRFLVEAFWATLNIRTSLISLAQAWLEEAGKREAYSALQQQNWATYVDFLLRTYARDAEIAYHVALQSESHRQVTKTALFLMRAELERFQFNLFMCRKNDVLKTERRELSNAVKKHAEDAEIQMNATVKTHLAKRRGGRPEDEANWVEENFTSTARAIVEEWQRMEQTLRADTFYQPVSLQERMEIVKGLNFSHAGHFYNCPNGHTFVITECGGASERGTCPECGAGIGGYGHRLDSSNTRATDFEEMARQAGAGESPWGTPW